VKILVPTKRVPDPDQRMRVSSRMNDVDSEGMSYILNPFDTIAVEEALRIREKLGKDVEVVSIGVGGPGYEQDLRTALAMGADRAIWVESDERMDPWNVACVLHAIVKREKPSLVLMGKQAVDDDSNQCGQFLAAQLDWPQATFASKIEWDDQRCRVWRETDSGIETVMLSLPAVITTDLRLNEPRYASLTSIMRAKRKTIERCELHELGVENQPRVNLVHMESVSTERKCVMVDDVGELIDRLRNEAKVIT